MLLDQADDPIRPLHWSAARGTDAIEVFSLVELFARFPEGHFAAVERPEFHLVVIGDAGVGTHEVDFSDVEVRADRVLHIAPGQVHRWKPSIGFEATVVIFSTMPGGVAPAWRFGASAFDLGDRASAVRAVIALIREEVRSERSETQREIALRALRDLLVVRLDFGSHADRHGPEAPDAYWAFRDDLESDLNVASTMTERASRIGYSARTISRACLEVSGRTAKQLTDERMVLEARRLLARPDATASQVASALGFSEPTNFAKYFRRHTSLTPSEWRSSVIHSL